MLDDDPGTPPSTQPLLASASWLPLRQHIPMQPLSRAKEEEPADTQSLLLLMEEKWCGADRVFARARQFSLLRRFVHTRAQRVRAGAVHVHRTSGALGQSRGSLLAGILRWVRHGALCRRACCGGRALPLRAHVCARNRAFPGPKACALQTRFCALPASAAQQACGLRCARPTGLSLGAHAHLPHISHCAARRLAAAQQPARLACAARTDSAGRLARCPRARDVGVIVHRARR